jgi:hypothetical protein
MISSPGGDPGFLSVSTTSPLFFSRLLRERIKCSIFSVRENIIILFRITVAEVCGREEEKQSGKSTLSRK